MLTAIFLATRRTSAGLLGQRGREAKGEGAALRTRICPSRHEERCQRRRGRLPRSLACNPQRRRSGERRRRAPPQPAGGQSSASGGEFVPPFSCPCSSFFSSSGPAGGVLVPQPSPLLLQMPPPPLSPAQPTLQIQCRPVVLSA
ncbi:hypothetical protein PVAP13_9NG301073 [Panicum virgatum]|uniref:Uncharacterized protein n=1 Tax=Panicum virgatum TaxID=38727 RepID=A0A8T0MJL5_PANVG|nr:hypothetical protein PVAP13_9NG301073 [Panicum virgatum]